MNRHGGNRAELAKQAGCLPSELWDFSANINPLGPPEQLWHVLAAALPDIVHYPDPEAEDYVSALAHHVQVPAQNLVVGNGTSELLYASLRALRPPRALIPVPAYVDYRQACERVKAEVLPIPLLADQDFQPDLSQLARLLRPGDLLVLGQPNNPTGRMNQREALVELAADHPEAFFLIDEAFAGFVQGYQSLASACADNILTLCSLTKIFALPGLRLGFLAAAPDLAKKIRAEIAPWPMNTLAQAAGVAVLREKEYLQKSPIQVAALREDLHRALSAFPQLHVTASAANFLLLRLAPPMTAAALAEQLLLEYRIAVRVCADYEGLDGQYLRVAVRQTEENQRLIEALEHFFTPKKRPQRQARPRPALMLLGTGSDVGKSVLAAGLCRVLLHDGLRVAPFKAQNMSLNSYVTRDGGEIGRAQVVQAQACRLDPDVRMNPILLKPSSDQGSQVIVCGKPVGNMQVAEYIRYKEQVWQEVCRAYTSLAAEHDCMILEGAGSAGEINLKAHDIVNMRMAAQAQAAALLVGDIDRGGVYASFVGHVELMAPWERNLLAGFVVNRFRGDASLLRPAHDFIEQRSGKPVLGVIPWLADLNLPQEDSVSFKAGTYQRPRPEGPHVELALIDLPHISNFTDFEPLLAEPDIWLRTVRRVEELGQADCLFLPGSKNVMADALWLQQQGWNKILREAAAQGRELVGICGGFQLLGQSITDPHGIEGERGQTVQGLGLLDLHTELAADKTLTRRQGSHLPSGMPVHGYEIHHGRSHGANQPLLHFGEDISCGCAKPGSSVWGCYLHGLFDSDPFRRWFINHLRQTKGLSPFHGQGVCYDFEPALERLAQCIRQELNMDMVYRLLRI